MRAALLALVCSSLAGAGLAATPPVPTVSPGTVVRWSAPGTTACRIAGRTWAPTGATCFFPVDLLATGTLRLERERASRHEGLLVRVGPYPYPEQRLEVDDRFVHLSPENEARAAREAARIAPLWELETRPRCELPLAMPLPGDHAGTRFGARRVFNGEPRSPHAGLDLKAAAGTEVLAAADGVVVLAEEHFFAGNSIYVDHGGGLVTVAMHLSEIDVKAGQKVRRGQRIGLVGATGRVTGPHLHFAVRWHGARVDPSLLFKPVATIPEL